MKKSILAASIIAASISMTACKQDASTASGPAAGQAITLESDLQKVSYGIGLNITQNFRQQDLDLDQNAFRQGIEDGLSDAEAKLDQETIMQAMQTFQKQQMEKQAAKRKASETENKVASEQFLAENASKEGVQITESGLQYKVVTQGENTNKPLASDTVVVHYRGTLIDGEEFDSSYSRNQPATFGVGNVIPGWTEALQLMSPGDKYELYIPSDLAYGQGGAGAKIGPNSALIFEVELLEILDPAANEDEEAAAE